MNVALAIGLAPVFGFLAAAIGTTVAGWAMLALLWFGVRRLDPELRMDARLCQRVPRLALASVLMGGAVLGVAALLETVFPGGPGAVGLMVIVASGVVVYTLAGELTGGFRRAEIKATMRRGKVE